MKYFIDTEFHEYQKKTVFGKPIDTIELISIGIVSEGVDLKKAEQLQPGVNQMGLQNGDFKLSDVIKGNTSKEYYAICKEFDLKAAWNNEWLRKNVLLPIYIEHISGDWRNHIPFSKSGIKWILNTYGKTRKQIAEEIKEFTLEVPLLQKYGNPEFYAYYADYDWVVFCWLFGRMIDLPKGFPMFAFDIQQLIEDNNINKEELINKIPQEGIHNSLQDAIWNKKAFNYIQTILNEKRTN